MTGVLARPVRRRTALQREPHPGEHAVFSIGCLLAGHDDMVVREAGRMWLQCQRCGRDTPGWRVNGHPPTCLVHARATVLTLQPIVINGSNVSTARSGHFGIDPER